MRINKTLPSVGLLVIGFASTQAQVARTLESYPKQVHNTTADTPALNEAYFHLAHKAGLMGRGTPTIYRDNKLAAIQFPVGGIGTGCIQFNGEGRARYWQIFNNMTHDPLPNSFFAIRTKQGKNIAIAALQTSPINGLPTAKSLTAQARFPFLTYKYETGLPVGVAMRVSNPFIPTDLKSSGIPAVFYEFELYNPTDKPLEVSLLGTQQNAVGYTKIQKIVKGESFKARFEANMKRVPVTENKSKMYGGNFNIVSEEHGSETLYMEGSYAKDSEHFGQMALLVMPSKGTKINATAQWKNIKSLVGQFKKTGILKAVEKTGKSKKGTTYSGATTASLTLQPKECKTVHFALAWYFPNGKNGGHLDRWDAWGKGKWQGNGNYYANYWNDIKALTTYLYKNHNRLIRETNLFTDTFFETNFPIWLNERLSNQLSIIKSRTIFHDKNNYVGLWEGAGSGDGSCAGNCNHVWHYAQAHARLFPKLARTIRSQAFDLIKKDGRLPYRQPNGSFAFDGQLGEILASYREYLMDSDKRWLISKYPAIKKALNYVIEKYDADKDGWLNSAPKHTTYDASMSGNPSFLTSLYLAGLAAGAKMATINEDEEQAKEWHNIADKSAKIQSKRLFNGEYFIQIPGKQHATDYETGCQSDQLLGQWWASQIGLGNLYPAYQIKSATQSVLKYNFKAILKDHNQGGRFFGLPTEAGFIANTWPKGDRPAYASGYSDEIWTTYEYTIGSALIRQGLIRDALTILRAGYERYDGELKTDYPSANGWGNFGFSGNPFGDDECGQFYGRALCNWSVLLAAQGFQYNGVEKALTFAPNWQSDDHRSFFSTAKGWGLFSQTRNEEKESHKIALRYGQLALEKLQLARKNLALKRVKVKVNEKEIKVEARLDGAKSIIRFKQPLALKAGDLLAVTFD